MKTTVHIHNAKLATPTVCQQADVLILASPTYGHGQLDQYMDRLISQMPQVDFGGKPCAIVGLGDDLYDHDYRIESVRILVEFVEKHNGKLVVPPLGINKSPVPYLETTVTKWAENLLKKLT
jgi:flavodoxin